MSNKNTDIKEANQEAFLEAMKSTYGNISQACDLVDIDPSLPHKWKVDDEDFKVKMYSPIYKQIKKDAIEEKLLKVGIIDENPTVLIFLSKTQLKDRGYIESHRVEYTNDTPTPVTREEVEESIKRIAAMMNGKLTVTKKIA